MSNFLMACSVAHVLIGLFTQGEVSMQSAIWCALVAIWYKG